LIHLLPASQGYTPLHWAAKGGQPVAVARLVEKGANVKARDAVRFLQT
jgi:ankyrin repeat protein